MPPLELVDPDAIRALWPELRKGVAKALRREADGATPAAVLAALLEGRAGCYVHKRDGMVAGLLIAKKLLVYGRHVFCVWLTWHAPGEMTVKDFWPQVVALAKAVGCSRITIESPRPFDRVLPVKKVYHVYHHDLED